MRSKRCTKCGETKPVSEFHRRNTEGTDGYRSHCKSCARARDKRTPEAENARATAYYWANKTQRQAYVKANLHLFREQSRRRRERLRADPEVEAAALQRARERKRDRYANEPGYAERAIYHVVLREKRKLGGYVEDVHPLVRLELDDGQCGICGEDVDPTDFHVDHIVPLSRGGEHSYANTQTAHPKCNQRKGAMAPD